MVYLIHFEAKYCHAQHYIGYTESPGSLPDRLARHRAGDGSPLLRAVCNACIPWSVVRTWSKADRFFERRLKLQKNTPRLCPICNPTGWTTRETNTH